MMDSSCIQSTANKGIDKDNNLVKLERKLKRLFVRNPKQLKESENSWLTEFVHVYGRRNDSRMSMDIVDKLLAARLIAMIKDGVPNSRLDDLIPSIIPELVINQTVVKLAGNRATVWFPSFILKYDGKSPFVGNGLVLTFNENGCDYYGISLMINDFGAKYASMLSVLCLKSMHLHMAEFICLLKGAKNISILILQDFQLGVKDVEELRLSRLPELTNLTTLLLLKHFSLYSTTNSENNRVAYKGYSQLTGYNTWIFNPYASHLQKVEMRHFKKLQFDAMPELKNLSVVTSSLDNVIPFNIGKTKSLGKLEILCLSGFAHVDNKVSWARVFKFMSTFASSLTEVYFDIKLIYTTAESEVVDTSVIGLQFPHVRKLTLNIPRLPDEKQYLLNFVLGKFPSLEEIFMLDYEKHSCPYPFHHTFENPTIGASSFRDRIWQQCSKLKLFAILKWKPDSKNPTLGFYSQTTLARPKL